MNLSYVLNRYLFIMFKLLNNCRNTKLFRKDLWYELQLQLAYQPL